MPHNAIFGVPNHIVVGGVLALVAAIVVVAGAAWALRRMPVRTRTDRRPRPIGGRRPTLDGIRAVAILAVIAYHFGFGGAQGGFLGVDVFFVLSGYLITSLLLAERERTGRIALVAFWVRRAKRLLPALLVLLVVVVFWIGANTSRFELTMRRDDVMSALFYWANWHFIGSGEDYFAQFISASPVRHTWSLAIEEQFYLAWPIICAVALLITQGRRHVVAAVCIVGILGSAIAMFMLYTPLDPSRAYYGTDARIHQLLIGALLAVLMTQLRSVRLRRIAIVIGPTAGLILLLSIGLLPDSAPIYYQGLSVALALVTAMLVWSLEVAPESTLARIVGVRPMAWIGEISYGLYLWHWPIALAVDHATGPFALLPSTVSLGAERLSLTFGIATASYYLIEQPIRRGRMPAIGASVRRFAVATLVAIVAVIGIANWQTNSGAAAAADVVTWPKGCPEFSICLRHQGSPGAPVIAVIGDSIAMSLDPAFLAISEQRDWTYVLEATGYCRTTNLMGAHTGDALNERYTSECYAKIPTLERKLLEIWHPKVVIDIDNREVTSATGPDGSTYVRGTPEMLQLEERALTDLAKTITGGGSQLVLMNLSPVSTPDCTQVSKITTDQCRPAVNNIDRSYYAVYDHVAHAVTGVSQFSITDRVCPGDVCSPIVNGLILRSDGVHFTRSANLWLAATISARVASVSGLR